MRLLLVTRESNKYWVTKNISAFNATWWGVAITYIGVITSCCFINMSMNPGGEEMYDWYNEGGARITYAKIFQTSAFVINLVGTLLVCFGIYWFKVHCKTRISVKGACFTCLFIYYVVWQSLITMMIGAGIIIFSSAYNWLPATVLGMTFMNLPFLSAMSGSDSFCEIFGVTASYYF